MDLVALFLLPIFSPAGTWGQILITKSQSATRNPQHKNLSNFQLYSVRGFEVEVEFEVEVLALFG